MSISVSLIPIQERATEFLKNNPRAKLFMGITRGIDADYFTIDKKDSVYLKEFLLDTGEDILEVHLSRPARIWFNCGTEVWIIGEEITSNVVQAQMVLLTDTRQVLDLVKERELYGIPLGLLIFSLLLGVFPLKQFFDLIAFLILGNPNFISMQIPLIFVSIVGFWVVYLFLSKYTPTPMTLTYHEWNALENVIITLGVIHQ